ncbi:MAG: class I SAM-dependent methyltransferase [Methylococcales bacterium]
MNGFVLQKNSRFYIDPHKRMDSLIIGEIILHELIRFLDENFKRGSQGTLLDAGAGTRPYVPVYRNYFSETYSIDTPCSPHDIASVDAIASAQHLPFPDATFDCVICTEVLEHIPDPVQALREFRRVLKTGGRLFVTTPFFNPLHEVPHDYYRYTPFALSYMAEQASLSLESLVEKGGIIAFTLLFVQYPWVRFWQRLSQYCRIPLLHAYNPAVYFVVILPQLIYIAGWKRQRRHRAIISKNRSPYAGLSAVTLGYVATFAVR